MKALMLSSVKFLLLSLLLFKLLFLKKMVSVFLFSPGFPSNFCLLISVCIHLLMLPINDDTRDMSLSYSLCALPFPSR